MAEVPITYIGNITIPTANYDLICAYFTVELTIQELYDQRPYLYFAENYSIDVSTACASAYGTVYTFGGQAYGRYAIGDSGFNAIVAEIKSRNPYWPEVLVGSYPCGNLDGASNSVAMGSVPIVIKTSDDLYFISYAEFKYNTPSQAQKSIIESYAGIVAPLNSIPGRYNGYVAALTYWGGTSPVYDNPLQLITDYVTPAYAYLYRNGQYYPMRDAFMTISNYLASIAPTGNFAVTTNLIGCTADPENPDEIEPDATSTRFRFIAGTNRYFDSQSVMITGEGYPEGQPVSFSWNYNTGVLVVHRVLSDITINVGAYSVPYSGGGTSEPGAGTGTYDFDNDEVPFGVPPILGGLNSGFVTLYSPTMAEVQNLARYMWAGSFDIDSLKKIFANPMDVILGFSIVPLTDEELGLENDYIAIGNIPTQLHAARVTNQYAIIDCGHIDLKGIWGAYLDYSPYTKIQLYLPYIGFVELSADDCMDSFIAIKYSVDIYSGACLAQIYCKDDADSDSGHVLYQFSGNCASWYPITSGQYQYFIISAYNILSGVGMGLAEVGSGIEDLATYRQASAQAYENGGASPSGLSGAIGKMIRGSVSSLNSITSNVVASIKPSVQRAGGAGGSSFMMAPQTPYLIITTPKMIIPGDQNKMVGYPSYVTKRLGTLNGFTVVDTIHPDGIAATEEEIAEIVSLLKSGVFL